MQTSQTSHHAKGWAATVSLLMLVLLAVIATARPAQAQLTLTSNGTALGLSLSTFASGFPTASNIGPAGIAFPTTGGVLVADFSGNVRLFSTDMDGQNAASAHIGQNYGANESFGLAQVGNNIYMTQGGNKDVVQINPDGTPNQFIVSVPKPATAIVVNPSNGHLFVDYGGSGTGIVNVDPIARTVTPFVNGLSVDGLSVSSDDRILYGAVYGGTLGGHILGFDINTGAQLFDSGFIPDGVDGTAVGYGSLAGNIFVNTNNGTVYEVSLANSFQPKLIASGGSRGDFVSVDPSNGTLMLTQSDRIIRLSGGSFAPVPEASTFVSTGALMLGGLGLLLAARKRARKG